MEIAAIDGLCMVCGLGLLVALVWAVTRGKE